MSKQEDLPGQLAELMVARDALNKAVKPISDLLQFQVGEPGLHAEFDTKEKRDKQSANAMMLRISFKIPADPLKQAAEFVKAIDAIKPPAGSRFIYSVRGTQYELTKPESHRAKLVSKAMEDLRGFSTVDTKQFKVTVTGLEKPLSVGQYPETEFLVSLQYSVNVESLSGAAEINATDKPK